MGRRTHGPHLLAAIDANNHAKVHDILSVQVRNRNKIREIITADLKRLASDNTDCPLLVTASLPDPTLIRYLVTKHSADVNFVHSRGSGKSVHLSTPLMVAVKKGLYSTVESLLELNANTNIQDHKGRTCLHLAVLDANCRMAKMLLTKGAQANLADKSDNTPLHIATRFGHMGLVKMLMQYSGDLYKRGGYGALPLHIATREGHIGMVELFCQHGMNINVKVPCFAEMREKSPLHIACEEGHVETTLTLIEKLKADINLPDSEGETPLHCTVLHEYDQFGMKSKDDFTEVALMLLQYGADPNKLNGRKETALHHAARNEFQKIVELLLIAGADATKEDLDRNRAIDLVSEDDAVTRNLLKRAVEDKENLMSELRELRGNITPTGIQRSRMSRSLTNMNMGDVPLGRTLSNPGLFTPDGTLVYSQEGYLQPFGSRPRLNSFTSQNSIGIQSFAGLPLSRQNSIGSFHSAVTAPMPNCHSIDSDGFVSEHAPIGVLAPRLIRRKHSSDKRRGNERSSDSSQSDEVHIKPKHFASTPRRSASVDLAHQGHQRTAKKPKGPLFIHSVGNKHSHNLQNGLSRHGPKRSSQTSLQSNQSYSSRRSGTSVPESDTSSLWDVTPHTSRSTLKEDKDNTSEENTSSRSTPDQGQTTDAPRPPVRAKVVQEDFDEIYENVPTEEDQPIYDNISDDSPVPTRVPSGGKPPELPPRKMTRQPLPTPQPALTAQAIQQVVNRAAEAATPDATIPVTYAEGKRSSQDITIKISPHQSITIKTSPSGQAQAVQINSTSPPDTSPTRDAQSKLNNTVDSDDTYFDDESFDTISDFLESDSRKTRHGHLKPVPPPKPTHLRSRKAKQQQMQKMLQDPKLHNWLTEQATMITEQRHTHGGEPLAHSTPPQSRRELENRLRKAFGKPPLSDTEDQETVPDTVASDQKDTPVAVSSQAVPHPQVDMDSRDGDITEMKASPGVRRRQQSAKHELLNDLSTPSINTNTVHREPIKQFAIQPMQDYTKDEEVPTLIRPADGDFTSEMFWDHADGTIRPAKPQLAEQTPRKPTETVYMEMNGHPKIKGQPQRLQHVPPSRSVVSNHIEGPEHQIRPVNNTRQTLQNNQFGRSPAVATKATVEEFDDDSFDSFESDNDDEGVPNSCHQVAVLYQRPPENNGISNIVLAGCNGDIVPHTRHSSTNARYVSIPAAADLAQRQESLQKGKPTSPKPRKEIVVIREEAQFNGLPMNQPSPRVIRHKEPVQDQRNPYGYSPVRKAPPVPEMQRINSVTEQKRPPDLAQNTSFTSINSASQVSIDSHQQDESSETEQRERRVTIGSEQIKLISDRNTLPKDFDHREIHYDTKGKLRISIIGGNSEGVFVHRIDPGSEPEQQGLMEGDQVLKVNGVSTKGRTKEEVMLQLMSLLSDVHLVVRHKKDIYNCIVQNGGMGDSFFVRAHFNHDPTQKNEMKICEGDIFSVRDTLPSGRMGSWQALKVNAKSNEQQHGLIPNKSRAEQVALASKKSGDSGRGITKEHRGSFIRRSLRRSKSAERLHKEQEAFTKTQEPKMEEVKTYERVEQRSPGFLRPVILIGLFCDTVRDRLLQDLPGMFEKPPLEVEIPVSGQTNAEEKSPVNVRMIQDIFVKNKHPLMIVSPRAIQYLQTTQLHPIVIYLSPGSKNIIKHVRQSLAPRFEKRSGYMFEEAQVFSRTYSALFTATVTYTADDSWFTLLKDTIQRIQNQPLWQTVSEPDHSQEDTGSISEYPQKGSPQRTGARPPVRAIPDQIQNALHRHATSSDQINIKGANESIDSVEVASVPRKPAVLTYDGYFLSDSTGFDVNRSPSVQSLSRNNGRVRTVSQNDCSVDDSQWSRDQPPRSILKNRSLSQSDRMLLESPTEVSPPRQYQQIGLLVSPPPGKSPNNTSQQGATTPSSGQQGFLQQQYADTNRMQQTRMARPVYVPQVQDQQMLIQQMFQQQMMQQHLSQKQQFQQTTPISRHPSSRKRDLIQQHIETDL